MDAPCASSRAKNAALFRIFHVTPGRAVTIEGLTIQNGSGSGGGGDRRRPDQSDGRGWEDGRRVAALEILMDTPRAKDLIKKGAIDELKDAMEQGVQEGCQTFDYILFSLYKAGKISLDQALINADSANNLRLKIKLAGMKGEDTMAKPLRKDEQSGGFQIKGTTGSPARKA